MKISYKKLWMLLIQKDITKVQLRKDLGIAPGTMSKLNKGEEVAMSVLLRICEYLDCDIGRYMRGCTPHQRIGGNMGFIQTIIEQHQKKIQERNDACNDLISRIDDALHDAKSIFSARKCLLILTTKTNGETEIVEY